MKQIAFCCLFCIACSSLRSQTNETPLAAVYLKTNAYSCVHNDAFSFSANQAALAQRKTLSIGAFGERRFMLADLSSYQLAFALPASAGNFGLQANYFGNTSFNQTKLGLAYARNLGKIDVGAQFNYHQIKIAGYGSASAVNFEAGAILHITDQFQTGVHVDNPTRVSFGKTDAEKLPFQYSFGLGYDVSEKFFIGTEMEKVEDQPVNVNAGLNYVFQEKLLARMGISSATSSFYLGAGFLWDGLRIDVTVSLHPSLGATPGLLLVYNSPEKK